MKRILLISFVLMSALISEAWAQRTVTGTVVSGADGTGLPGVTVLANGTSIGVTTDFNGDYRIEVPAGSDTLVYRFVGFNTERVAIGNRSVIDVTLMEDIRQLQEVVVTAFGIQRAANEVTYQTEKISAEDLLPGQPTNIAQGLTGKIAGLQINVQNNGVNPEAQVLLRGLRSISKDNEPLVVIDGSIATIGAFSDLNPQDIASIDVLKGASAAALYGSDASNGALIVTTKKGIEGEGFTVGLNSTYTINEVSFLPDFQTEHGIGWDGFYNPVENTNWGPRFDGVPRLIGPDFPADYPVEDQIVPYAPIEGNLRDFYQRGYTFDNTVYFSGGDETGSIYLSAGHQVTTGIVPDDEYERTTFRLNTTKTIGKLTLGLNSSYLQDDENVVGDDIGNQDRPLYWFVLNTPANIPLSEYSDWDNPLSYGYADNYYNAYYQNPYWAIGTNRDTGETSRLIASVNGNYEITDNIDLTGQLGVNRFVSIGKNWRDAQTYDPELQPSHQAVTSFTLDYEQQSTEVNGNVLLQGDFEFGDAFTLRPIVGAAFKSSDYHYSQYRANNQPIAGFYSIANRTGQLEDYLDEELYRTYGLFADVTLGYNEWAFLNLSGRQDYTSTLPIEDNSYFYPQASLSLVLSEAIPTLTENDVLSDLKVTASRSVVYNDLDPYEINETYSSPAAFPFGGIAGFDLSRLTIDPNIQKEKLDTWEFGLQAGLFDNRLNLNATYFTGSTTNLITNTTPSYASGATQYLTNIGELSSSGLEFALNAVVVQAGDFSWNVNANYTSYESIIEEIKPGLDEIALDNYGSFGTFAIKGLPFPQVKAQSYLRDPEGRVIVDAATGNPKVGPVVTFGKATPDYILGLTSQWNYKGLSLSTTLDYRTGHVYYSQGSDAMEFTGRSIESVSSNRQDFIFPNSVVQVGEGENAEYFENTIPISGGIMGFWQNTYNEIKENYVKDASSFKVREIALNYTLPTGVLEGTGFVKTLRIGLVGRNLITVLPDQSNFSDPEFKNTRSTDDPNGIGIGGYFQSPPTRSYGVNLNIEF